MVFIGNDIISLKDKKNQASFSNSRYLKKAFNTIELDQIRHFKHISYLPFLFWTCKESAYKILVKQGLRKAFSPGNFKVSFTNHETFIANPCNNLYCNVQYDGYTIHTLSSINSEYIHTIAANCNSSISIINSGIKKINLKDLAKQSICTRNYLIDSITKNLNIQKTGISISYDSFTRAPLVQFNHIPIRADVSLSHDMEFISYAYLCYL